MSQFDEMNRHATAAASLLKALAHPERLMVLCQLVEGEKGVGELLAHSQL
ncbi:MAG: transcriptional regulator, partial [Aeromonas veronii]